MLVNQTIAARSINVYWSWWSNDGEYKMKSVYAILKKQDCL